MSIDKVKADLKPDLKKKSRTCRAVRIFPENNAVIKGGEKRLGSPYPFSFLFSSFLSFLTCICFWTCILHQENKKVELPPSCHVRHASHTCPRAKTALCCCLHGRMLTCLENRLTTTYSADLMSISYYIVWYDYLWRNFSHDLHFG